MNLRLILPAIAGIFVAASCTPYVEPPPEAPIDPAQRRVSSEEEQKQKIREQREAMKKEREGDRTPEKEKKSEGREIAKKDDGGSSTPGGGSAGPDRPTEIPVARPVPGKPGFVFSPFNNQLIDVKGFPPGTLVADPTYPASEKKRFRVP